MISSDCWRIAVNRGTNGSLKCRDCSPPRLGGPDAGLNGREPGRGLLDALVQRLARVAQGLREEAGDLFRPDLVHWRWAFFSVVVPLPERGAGPRFSYWLRGTSPPAGFGLRAVSDE